MYKYLEIILNYLKWGWGVIFGIIAAAGVSNLILALLNITISPEEFEILITLVVVVVVLIIINNTEKVKH